jgi:hypothetical protein
LNSWTEVRRITGVLLEVAREVAEQERERAVEKEIEISKQIPLQAPPPTVPTVTADSSDDEILRLRAEILRLQLEVEELKRRSSVEVAIPDGGTTG